MSKKSPFKIQYYQDRVEFQARGHPHIHGMAWSKTDELDKIYPGLHLAFAKLKERVRLLENDIRALVSFADATITCSRNKKIIQRYFEECSNDTEKELMAGVVKERVTEVNVHHHTKTCRKHETECRFEFPRYPSDFTLISQEMPSEVKKIEEETIEAIHFVRKVIKNKLKELQKICEEKEKVKNKSNVEEFEEKATRKKKGKSSIQIEESLDDILELCFPDIGFSSDGQFIILLKEDKKISKFKIKLVKATLIEGGHTELTNFTTSKKVLRSAVYHYSLSISDHGVKVVLRRESNDIFVNNYNPHYMLAWNANMDIQLVLDYFSIITYMCDYVCKPETKTTEMLKDVKKAKEKEKIQP